MLKQKDNHSLPPPPRTQAEGLVVTSLERARAASSEQERVSSGPGSVTLLVLLALKSFVNVRIGVGPELVLELVGDCLPFGSLGKNTLLPVGVELIELVEEEEAVEVLLSGGVLEGVLDPPVGFLGARRKRFGNTELLFPLGVTLAEAAGARAKEASVVLALTAAAVGLVATAALGLLSLESLDVFLLLIASSVLLSITGNTKYFSKRVFKSFGVTGFGSWSIKSCFSTTSGGVVDHNTILALNCISLIMLAAFAPSITGIWKSMMMRSNGFPWLFLFSTIAMAAAAQSAAVTWKPNFSIILVNTRRLFSSSSTNNISGMLKLRAE
jgi:hypothetical protein